MGNRNSGRCRVGGTHSGRAPDPLGRTSQIQYIQDWYHEAMRLIVMGWTNEMLCSHFGVSKNTICMIRNSSLTRRQIDIMSAVRDAKVMGVDEQLEQLADPAVKELGKMLISDATPSNIRKDVAFGILAASGHGPVKKVEGKLAIGVFTQEDADDLRNRRNQAIEEGVYYTEGEES